jgi:glycosyltransferase involved in cell wall biosynthesis
MFMKICIVTPDYPKPSQPIVTGVASVNYVLAHGLAEAGHSVVVVTLSRQAESVESDAGVVVHRLKPGNLHWYFSKIPWIGKMLYVAIKEIEISFILAQRVGTLNRLNHFDVIESSETGSLFIGFPFKYCPLVIRLHGEAHTFLKHTPNITLPFAQTLSRRLQLVALRRAEKLISPSSVHAEYISRELGKPLETIDVVQHGIQQEDQVGVELEQSVEPVILFAGRLELRKGIFDAFACIAQIISKIPSVRLVVVGSYHPTIKPTDIQKRIVELGIGDNVEKIGEVSFTELSNWYHYAQILLMPSYYETFGMVALEAMCAGLPVIAYSGSSLSEIIINDKTGFTVDRGNIDQLSLRVVELLSDPVKRHTFSQAARKRAAQFSVEKFIDGTLNVYGSVVESPKGESK